jgi:putative acyl-CoA dehydrogenase
MRLAGAADRAIRGDAAERVFRRIGVAVGKYWVPKRTPGFTAEALECLGGNGYVEESCLPRHYREAPLNSVWEGCGNVNALDVRRALAREPETAQALFDELATTRGADRHLDAAVTRIQAELADPADAEARARRIVELMALALQGSLLIRYSPAPVADAFCASRLGGDWGNAYGTLPASADRGAILERAGLLG